MKSILRILVLGAVPILAVTAVVDQGLAADKGSQLIFQSNMAHTSYISVVNAQPERHGKSRLRCWFSTTTTRWRWLSGI